MKKNSKRTIYNNIGKNKTFEENFANNSEEIDFEFRSP